MTTTTGPGHISPVSTFVAEVGYAGKKPMFVGTFRMDRAATEEEQIAAAEACVGDKVEAFWREHFPDNSPAPAVLSVRLGYMTFVPDDYEWRRG